MKKMILVFLLAFLPGCGGATLYQHVKQGNSYKKVPLITVDGQAKFTLERGEDGKWKKIEVDSKSEGLLKSTVKEITAVTVSREMRGGE